MDQLFGGGGSSGSGMPVVVQGGDPTSEQLANQLIMQQMQGRRGSIGPSYSSGGGSMPLNLFEQMFTQGGASAGGATTGDIGYAGDATATAGEGSAAAGSGGASAGGSSSISSIGLPALYAALIGFGKNTEAKHPGTAAGKTLLGLLGPSGSQIAKDPVGMGLPTLLGLPFLTPFTSSKSSQSTKPEWSKLFPFGL